MRKMTGRSSRNLRGAAMATLLVLMALFAVIAFTLAGGSMFHLNTMSRQNNGADAKNAAESVIARCIEKIIASAGVSGTDIPTYGESQTEHIALAKTENPSGASADVTFDPAQASTLGIPCSKYNVKSTTGTTGSTGRMVPRNSIHIVGVGKCNGVVKRLEAILYLPPFPFCVATTGQFKSAGDLLIASVSDPADLAGTIAPSKRKPGNLLANGTALDAVSLSGTGQITGDVQTSGDLDPDPKISRPVAIEGEIRTRADPVTITKITFSDYDPSPTPPLATPKTVTDPGSILNAPPPLQGYYKTAASLAVTGDLVLDGALLYVTSGGLTVSGGIKGRVPSWSMARPR
jgi:hypothetical protein